MITSHTHTHIHTKVKSLMFTLNVSLCIMHKKYLHHINIQIINIKSSLNLKNIFTSFELHPHYTTGQWVVYFRYNKPLTPRIESCMVYKSTKKIVLILTHKNIIMYCYVKVYPKKK
jgi:hypothetical protein